MNNREEKFVEILKAGGEVNVKDYCSDCLSYGKKKIEKVYDNLDESSWHYEQNVECNGMFAACGSIPCKFKKVKEN